MIVQRQGPSYRLQDEKQNVVYWLQKPHLGLYALARTKLVRYCKKSPEAKRWRPGASLIDYHAP
jgi:hypothetical protein